MSKNDIQDSDNLNKDGNVILLIVIAIATMIIVVVGATFAYLETVIEQEDSANITGTTEGGGDMFLLDAGDDINIDVTYDNFGIQSGNVTDETIASIMMSAGENDSSHKYKMYLKVEDNDFEYTSGSCYSNVLDEISAITSREECAENGNLWARLPGEDYYSCYSKANTEKIENELYNQNEVTCSVYGNSAWVQEAVPELVLDIYKNTGSTDEAACLENDGKSAGVCVKPDGSIIDDITDEEDCTDGNNWVNNEFKENKCFKYLKSVDITEASKDEVLEIIDSAEVKAEAGQSTADFYIGRIKMINLEHNQVVNNRKMFNGKLTLKIDDLTAE